MGNEIKILEGQGAEALIETRAVAGRDVRELYQKLLEAAPDAMVFVERTGRIVLVNDQMEALFGYPREELIGHDLHMLIPERYRDRHKENIDGFFANPHRRPMGSGLKIYGLKKDGAEFRADISLSPIDIGGELLVAAAIRDITERVRAEEQIEFNYQIQRVISTILKIALEPISLEEQLNRTMDLIISIPDPSYEAKGMIYLSDDKTGELALKAHRGFPETEGLPSEEELPAPLMQKVLTAPQCEITSTGNADAPYEMMHKHSSSFVHYCIPIYEGEKMLGLISIFAREWPGSRSQEDVFFRAVAHTLAIIIKHSRIEDERQKLLDQLAQSEKLAALGRISANVAHEIRNPLTVVGGFARRLQNGIAGAREREYAGFIVSEVNRLEEILKEILTYARTTVLHVKEYRIGEIVADTLGMYEEICRERSITVRKSYEYTGEVAVDKVRAREVIGNVVSNAVDAMTNGGALSVSTALEKTNGDQFVTVRISDTGEGIPADKLQKIFEPFFTTKVVSKGIGLGLSISRKIMEDHGGFITAASTPGKGSTFTLYFPLKRNA